MDYGFFRLLYLSVLHLVYKSVKTVVPARKRSMYYVLFIFSIDNPWFPCCLCSQLEQGLLFPRQGRRGRKRKEEKMAEIAMAEALARRQTARALAGLDNGGFFLRKLIESFVTF